MTIFWRVILSLTLIAIAVIGVRPEWVVVPPPMFEPVYANDKYDGNCTGYETAGRCSDKCADPASYMIGFDKETGQAICKVVTACPYADSVPLGAACDKLAPVQPVNYDVSEPFIGK